MISPDKLKLLQELKNTPYGVALKEFLTEKKNELNDVNTCKSYEEVLGRQLALKTLKDLFSFMERRESIDKSKNQYL